MSGPQLIHLDPWEKMWAPYDDHIYQFVLEQIRPNDITLEIGAGDLRLARQLSNRAQWVYAVEINQSLVDQITDEIPANCQVLIGDAREIVFPEPLSVAVLLMRHCTHFALYYDKLLASSCRRLITNARWRMGIETIDLDRQRTPYQSLDIGWYACRCGAAGFKPGPPQMLTLEVADQVWELDSCPICHERRHDGTAHAH